MHLSPTNSSPGGSFELKGNGETIAINTSEIADIGLRLIVETHKDKRNTAIDKTLVDNLMLAIFTTDIVLIFANMAINSYQRRLELRADELHESNARLTSALQEVKQLSGFLPICASCKTIRDDKGYWNKIEAYISERSDAQFSHGICPECIREEYPDFADEEWVR